MKSLARCLADVAGRPRPAEPVPILLTITDLDVGGAERALVALATGLDPARWRPAVVCLGPEGVLAGTLRERSIETVCLGVSPRRPFDAVRRLRREAKRLRPALVQSFLFHANIASRLAAFGLGLPVLGGLRVAEREKAWHLALDRLTHPLGTGSVCVSRGVMDFSMREGGLAPDRLTVIPNGIEPGPYDLVAPLDRADLGLDAADTIVLFVGRLEPQKAVPVLLDAFEAHVLPEHPAVRLLIVGDGPDRGPLEQRIRSSENLQCCTRLLGRRDDVPALLGAADFLVLPSLWEGMPNVVLEAMAARKAVVGTAVEGTSDLVLPGQTGWLVPPGDASALGTVLREAVSDRDRLRRFGETGRARVEAEFSQAAVVAAYDRLWSAVLGYRAEDTAK